MTYFYQILKCNIDDNEIFIRQHCEGFPCSFEKDENIYVILDYAGIPLRKIRYKDELTAAWLILRILEKLNEIHNTPINFNGKSCYPVHNDIKPDNILVLYHVEATNFIKIDDLHAWFKNAGYEISS